MFQWIYEHLSAAGYVVLVWGIPVAIVYFSSKWFGGRFSHH